MHSCPNCGMACDCDFEDHEQEAPEDCCHQCDELPDDEDELSANELVRHNGQFGVAA